MDENKLEQQPKGIKETDERMSGVRSDMKERDEEKEKDKESGIKKQNISTNNSWS